MPLTELSSFARLDEFDPARILARVYVPGQGVCQGVHFLNGDFPPLARWLHAHCCRSRKPSRNRDSSAESQAEAEQ
jgi:hypothetical protein